MYVQLLLVACMLQLGSFQGLSDVRNSTVCYNDAGMRTRTLACGGGGFINVLHVEVGYFLDCSSDNGCSFEEISPGNAYYQHILSECNGKTTCLLNSTVVREQRFKKGFNLCGGLNIQDRNAVKLECNCQGSPSMTTGSAVATETELILTYSTPSEGKSPQGSSSSNTSDRTESEQMSGAKEKQVMFLPLTTILGIVGGSVIVLALLCLGMVLLLRHRRRKSQHDQHKKKGSMAANSTDDFTYYSTISGDGGKNAEAPAVTARPLPVLNLPPAERVYQHPHYDDVNVYSELDSPTYQDPSNQATNELYSLCEPSPPCACLTNQRRDKPVDLVSNSLYHKAYEASINEDEH